MFDVTSRSSYENVANWYRDLIRVCGNIPIVLVGNKCDMRERGVNTRAITFHEGKNMAYFNISVRTHYNFEKPFRWLARQLTYTPDLKFEEALAINPPEVQFNEHDDRVIEGSASSHISGNFLFSYSTVIASIIYLFVICVYFWSLLNQLFTLAVVSHVLFFVYSFFFFNKYGKYLQ